MKKGLGIKLVLLVLLLTILGISSSAFAHPETEERIEVINAKLAEDPSNAALYLKRGDLHREHEDWKAALDDFEKARVLNPSLAEVDFFIGKTLLEAGELQGAREALSKFVLASPDNADGFVLRARTSAGLGESMAAVEDLDRAISIAKKPAPDLYIERAQLLKKLGPAKLEQLASGLSDAIRRFGPLVTMIDMLVDAELQLGRYEQAIAHIDLLPAKIGSQPSWLARRGDILMAASKKAEAKSAYQSALLAIDSLRGRRRSAVATQELRKKLEEKLSALR